MRNITWLLFCLVLQGCISERKQQSGDLSQASLKKAAAYNVQLGLLYLKQNNRERAQQKLLLAQKEAPGSADVHAALAYYYETTKEYAQAEQYYLKALALSGNKGAQLNNYGTFLCRRHQYQTGLRYFLKAVQDRQYVHAAGAYENAGLCSLAIPDYNGAAQYFAKALQHDPARHEALYEWVTMENKRGNKTKVLALLKRYPEGVARDSRLSALVQTVSNAQDPKPHTDNVE